MPFPFPFPFFRCWMLLCLHFQEFSVDFDWIDSVYFYISSSASASKCSNTSEVSNGVHLKWCNYIASNRRCRHLHRFSCTPFDIQCRVCYSPMFCFILFCLYTQIVAFHINLIFFFIVANVSFLDCFFFLPLISDMHLRKIHDVISTYTRRSILFANQITHIRIHELIDLIGLDILNILFPGIVWGAINSIHIRMGNKQKQSYRYFCKNNTIDRRNDGINWL